MRKCYLFLMMLFMQLIMCGNVFAADPPQEEYERALATIKDGNYYLVTEVDGVKWYVGLSGDLTADEASRGLFAVSWVSGGALFDKGLNINPGTGGHFSNTTLTDNKANLDGAGVFRLDTSNDRNDWERQVPYMNEEGKIAIRSCNTAYGESSWADAGRAFWTYKIAEGQDWPTACYSYEPAYIWEFETPPSKDQVYTAFNAIYTKYEDQVWDDLEEPATMGSGFGTEFGQFTAYDTWVEFWNLLQKVDSICNVLIGEGYDYDTDPNHPTVEQAETMSVAADSLYQAILNSEVPYTSEDGYYRIIAVKRYKSGNDESGQPILVDKALTASYETAHKNKAVYSTVKEDLANQVWKLTKSESGDSIMIQNVGMETYISFSSPGEGRVMMTEDVNDASCVVFDFAGNDYVEPNGEPDYKDLFAIRLASSKRVSGSYIHQNNHGSVAVEGAPWPAYETDRGAEEELTFWNTTRGFESTANDKWTSEWFLVPVSEEEVTDLKANFDLIKNHDLLVAQNKELRDKVLAAMDAAKDLTVIKKADQLSSPHSDPDEGKDLGALIDNNGDTFWHTTWHGYAEGVTGMKYYGEDYGEEGRECHYLQISGTQDLVGDCELYWRERAGADNDRPTKIVLMGAESATTPSDEWVEMAVVDIPNSGKGEENTIPLNIETAYPFIRILVIEVNSGFRSFWHAAEIQFKLTTPGPTSQFVTLGEVATALESAYEANLTIEDEDVTLDDYNALLEAYNAFMSAMVDPIEMRNALAKYAKATEGVVEGTNPGQWASTEVPEAYNALYAEVEAYNKAGKYNAAQVHKYAVMLKAMQKSVMEKANVVETDKWYRIMFPTEDMYDPYGFTKDGGDKTGLREDQSTMWGTFVTPAVEKTEQSTVVDEETGEETTVNTTYLEFVPSEDLRESARLFFMADDAIEEKDLSMFRFVENEQEEVDETPLFQDAKENMGMALDMSYVRGEKLITDASQFSSNASAQNNDGGKLADGVLLDGKVSTYWHTDYQQKVLEIPYLQVALNEPISGLVQVEIGRRSGAGNGHVVRMYVQGSTDAENWTNVGYIDTPYSGNTSEIVSSQPLDLDGTYSHLRFILTYRYGTDGGGNMEFDPFAEINGKEDWNKKWSYFHCSEFQIYPLTPAGEQSAAGQALLNAFNTANKILLKDVTAEDLAATADAYRAYRSEFNAAEGKEILPLGKDKVDPSYAIQHKATGLFIFANDGKGGNTNNMYLKTIPTFFDYKAIGYERSLMHGTNLNGSTPNNLHAGESNCRLCTWGSTEPGSNSGLVIREADEEYAAPEAFTFLKDIKPGRIIDWCHSVSLTPVDAPDEAEAYTAVGQYTVGEDEEAETFLALNAVETIAAGDPALYIYGDTASYDAEDDFVEAIKFSIPGNEKPVVESTKVNGLVGTLVPMTLDVCQIYFDANHVGVPASNGSIGLTACSAYLDLDNCPQVEAEPSAYDFSVCLGQAAKDVADGVKDIASTLDKISQRGNVYSIDGKLLMTNANLNSLKTLGTGMYILNGVKVYVK